MSNIQVKAIVAALTVGTNTAFDLCKKNEILPNDYFIVKLCFWLLKEWTLLHLHSSAIIV